MPKYFILPAVLITAASLTTSCVDSDYDLDNIDMTLGVNGDLTLPFFSTSDIVLRSIMDLEEDGVVQFIKNPNGEDSIFVVRQTGSTDIDPINIDAISFNNPTINPFTATINMKEMMNESKARRARAASNGSDLSITVEVNGTMQTVPVYLEEKEYAYEITSNDDTAFQMDDINATGISSDLTELTTVELEKTLLTADLKCDIYKFSPFIKNIHLDNSQLSFPVGLNVTSASILYTNADKQTTKSLAVDNGKGIVTIFDGASPAMDVSKDIKIFLELDEATVDNNNIKFTAGKDGGEGEMTIKGEFRMDGSFRMDTEEMDRAELQKKLDAKAEFIKENFFDETSMEVKDLDLFEAELLPGYISVDGEAEFGSDIKVASVSGQVVRKVDNPDPIKLDDMPDFLDDDDVVLDLDNPAIFMTIQNDLPSVATTQLTMKADTGTETVVRQTSDMEITNGTNLFMMADKEATFRPEGYEKNVKWVKVDDLGGLIRKLPDQVDIEIAPVTMEAQKLAIPGTYDISLDYEIFSPLTCGPDFKLVYSDTERGWAEDMEDLEKMDAGYIHLEALAESNLPADITLSIEPIDEEGHTLTSMKTVEIKIPAGSTDHAVSFNLEAADGFKMNDIFAGKNGSKRLDGVRYRAIIDNPNQNDPTLRDSAKIRLYKIKTTLKGGIIYDAN